MVHLLNFAIHIYVFFSIKTAIKRSSNFIFIFSLLELVRDSKLTNGVPEGWKYC